jgi:hypothetical protein
MKSEKRIEAELKMLDEIHVDANAVLDLLNHAGASEEEDRAHRDLAVENMHAHAFKRGARWALWWVLEQVREGPTENAVRNLCRTVERGKRVAEAHEKKGKR